MRPFICFLIVLFFLPGCHQKTVVPPIAVPEVVVESVLIRDIQPYIEATGKTEAYEFVQIPARVSGFLREVRFKPGDIVVAGTPLFLIEQDQYLAEVKSAQAQLGSAKAQLKLTEANLARTQSLIDQGASTEQDLDTDKAKRDEAEAAVLKAEAALATAELNLSYTDVRSPITGKVDRNLVDVGNLVGPATGHVKLTTVAGMDPIYIYFDISDYQFNHVRDFAGKSGDPDTIQLAKQLQELKRKNRAPDSVSEGADEKTKNDDPNRPAALSGDFMGLNLPFEVALAKGAASNTREYPYRGLVDMTSNVINRSTGTMTMRGEIPNSRYAIFPGQICYVRIPTAIDKDALLVKERAVLTDMNNRYVFIVDEKNRAERRNVTLGKLQPDGMRVVTGGLKKGERYILVGGQKVRNHGDVKPIERKKEATARGPRPEVAE